MSKQLLKDFKSFLMEMKSDSENWYHTDKGMEFHGVRSEEKHPEPVLSKYHKDNSSVHLVYSPTENGQKTPYSVDEVNKQGDSSDGGKVFSKLSHALQHLKNQGHEVPSHHVTKFKDLALKHSTSKSK